MEALDVLQPPVEDVGSFALSLLGLAERVADGVVGPTFQLPSLRLEVTAADPAYLADCRRALIDDPAYGDGPIVRVVVINRPDGRDLPPVHPTVSALGLGALFGQLETIGLRGAYDFDHGVWQFYDPARRVGVQVALEGRYAPWESSFPLRNFLHWHYETLGARLVHGATLGAGGIGVLLCGEGGAGKSGTTLGGMLHGLQSVGDDYVVVDPRGVLPKALPVMRLMKQDEHGLARLGFDLGAGGVVGPNWQDKYELGLDDQPAGSRVSELLIGAIVLPRVVGGDSSLVRPALRREAMLALAPSTLRQLPGGMANGLSFMADLARRVPSYHLDLSSNPAEAADAVGRLIGELRT